MSRNTVTVEAADLHSLLSEILSNGIPSHKSNERDRFFRLVGAYERANITALRYHHWGANKIAVIKAYRAFTGAGLKEAKQWSEGTMHSVNRGLAMELIEAGAVIVDSEGWRMEVDSGGLYREGRF